MSLSNGEWVLFIYGVGFIVSVLHLQNVYKDVPIEEAVLRSFMWPAILVYFVFQFFGYVIFSAIYYLYDSLTSNKNVYTEDAPEEAKKIIENR